jgi:hypothetical protein
VRCSAGEGGLGGDDRWSEGVGDGDVDAAAVAGVFEEREGARSPRSRMPGGRYPGRGEDGDDTLELAAEPMNKTPSTVKVLRVSGARWTRTTDLILIRDAL